ncbi:Acyl-CoA carboxylase epsilon subunit [Streptomyces sp. DI166]|uniref:acyl-CoA carboxylase subunit epsilon n=1 Tax=Streptomyces sp. DI166 TaxID=1839783 RepID=UPI0007F516F6|nr:acyl-CoA carboxylase subunit epsilon [Streptomyces sp. DI166]SBT93844.1 Acyl-CoA carboxylase epsilon subunit [Streptomyces sp. DI166]
MSATDSEERVIRVLRGEPTPEELSAVLTVLLALSGRPEGQAEGEPLPTQPPAVSWARTTGGGTSWAAPGFPYWAALS